MKMEERYSYILTILHGIHGFYRAVMPRVLRNCWFQGRSCTGSAPPHGCRCVLDASELRRRECCREPGAWGSYFFLVFLDRLGLWEIIPSCRWGGTMLWRKPECENGMPFVCCCKDLMTKLVARSLSAHQTLAIRWPDPKTSLRASQILTLTSTHALGSLL